MAAVHVITIDMATIKPEEPGEIRAFSVVRPAWAHSCGCKSHRELITTSEAKRNWMRATECGEEACSEAAG
jgi:hypothetical protein